MGEAMLQRSPGWAFERSNCNDTSAWRFPGGRSSAVSFHPPPAARGLPVPLHVDEGGGVRKGPPQCRPPRVPSCREGVPAVEADGGDSSNGACGCRRPPPLNPQTMGVSGRCGTLWGGRCTACDGMDGRVAVYLVGSVGGARSSSPALPSGRDPYSGEPVSRRRWPLLLLPIEAPVRSATAVATAGATASSAPYDALRVRKSITTAKAGVDN